MKSLATLAKEKGVKYHDCGNSHIQLTGVVLVNYYPDSRKQTAYIAGMVGSHHWCSAEEAVELALSPKGLKQKTTRTTHSARIKRALYRRSRVCHWCNKYFELKDATLDHVIPLSRGGLEHPSNRVLACEACNHSRKNDMPNEQFRQRTEPSL